MKRLANYLIAMTLMAFTFTSCEDVPNPFGQILPPGSGGEETVVIDPAGSGTQADPYNVQAIHNIVSALEAGVTLEKDYYVKGIVTNIPNNGISASYNNATFYISDDADGNNRFYIYRAKGLGGGDITDESFIKLGDEVVVFGSSWVNYQGNTPETSQGKAYVYSVNGKTGGDTPTPTPTPSEAKVVTVAEFLAAAESTTDWYQLTGTIKNLKDGDKYGNFDIEDATGSVYNYGLLSEKGGEKAKFQELVAAKGIANGKKITIIGNRGAYNGSPQVTNAYFVSIEDGGDTPTPTGNDGSLEKPFTPAEANAFISTMEAGVNSEKDYYIKGKIIEITDNNQFNTNYGNCTFYISDDGKDSDNKFYVYRTLYLGNVKYSDDSWLKPQAGDEVIICGKVVNYKGNTPETVGNQSYIYSLNGKTTPEGGGETGADGSTIISVADFNAAPESNDVWYQLTGTIKNLKDGDQYGNFDLEDSTGSVYVYGVLSEKGGEKKKFQDLVTGKGVANGKKITIVGNRGSYNGKIEVLNAYFIKVE